MSSGALSSLVDPAIMFFLVGVFAGAVRSNLEIPPQIAKFLSLYLLVALGFKGGQSLGDTGLDAEGLKVVGIALVLAALIPVLSFLVLRSRVEAFDAAAIAATYGSVSAVTFIAATNFVAGQGEPAGGYTTVALVFMESPAIVMAVLLASWVRSRQNADATALVADSAGVASSGVATGASAGIAAASGSDPDPPSPGPATVVESHATGETALAREALSDGRAPIDASGAEPLSVKAVLHEAFTDGAHLLLIGSLVVGFVVGDKGGEAMAPFTTGIFKGMLAFFLLEMGLLVTRQLRELRDVGPFLIGFGLLMPLCSASIALILGGIARLSVGDLTVLTVLAASASYIVVPAVIRYAIPEARPSRYFTMALAVTFPFNIVVGIPLYYAAAGFVAG